MPTIDELLIQIDASSELLRAELIKANAGIDNFERNTNAQLGKVNANFDALGKVASVAKGAILGFVTGLGIEGVARLGQQVLEFADNLEAAADQANVGVERFQTLRGAFRSLEVDAEQFDRILKRLIQTQGDVASGAENEATRALDKLGVSARILTGEIKTTDEVIDAIAEAFAGIEDPAQRAALAGDLVGTKLGPQFAAALAEGGKALSDAEQAFRDAGKVIDEEYIATLARANETWDLFIEATQQKAVIWSAGLITEIRKVAKEMEGLPSLFAISPAGIGLSAGRAFFADEPAAPAKPNRKADLARLKELENSLRTAESGAVKASPQALANLRSRIAGMQIDLGIAAVGEEIVVNGRRISKERSASRDRGGGKTGPYVPTPAELRAGINDPAEDIAVSIKDGSIAAAELLAAFTDLGPIVTDLSNVEIIDVEALEEAQYLATQFNRDLARGLADALVYGDSLGDVLSNTFKRAGAALLESQILSLLDPSGRSGGGNVIGTVLGSLFGGGRAGGGPVDPSKFYKVGERGPELFVPNTSGTIIPNGAMRGTGQGGQRQAVDVTVRTEPSPWFIQTVQTASAQTSATTARGVVKSMFKGGVGRA